MNFTGIILVLKSQDGVNLTHLGGPSSAASGREGAFLLQDVCDRTDSARRTRSARRALSLVVRLRNVSVTAVFPSRTVRSNKSAGSTPIRAATAIRFGSVTGRLSTRTLTSLPQAPSEPASRLRLVTGYFALLALPVVAC